MHPNLSKDFSPTFPKFAKYLDVKKAGVMEILPPASDKDITQLEERLGIILPSSYKKFIKITRGLWLKGGIFQMNKRHPFYHDWSDTPLKKWPPTQGMLCFAEYFLEADGDQVLFDVKDGLNDGEYAVYYYAHENPYELRKITDSFSAFIENALTRR